jgi:hypothetical protein
MKEGGETIMRTSILLSSLKHKMKGDETIMRKSLLLLAVALLVGGVALWSASPVLADATDTILGDQHFGDIDFGEDYTITLPGRTAAPGGYFANDGWDGQASLATSNSLGFSPLTPNGEGVQINGYLQGGLGTGFDTPTGRGSWFLPCPIEVSGIGNQEGGVGGAQVNDVTSDDYPGCTTMVASGETEEPLTNHIGLGNPAGGNDNGPDVTFRQGLYNFVSQDWVDNNVAEKGETYNPNPPNLPNPAVQDGTWSGTLDQDLATLFEYASDTAAGSGETGIATGIAGPFLGIDQTLDQGASYIQGTHDSPWPGDILDTSMRALYGDAQRIVQTFELTDTQARSSSGIQATDGVMSTMHQWVADWMRGTSTRDQTTSGGDAIGGGNEDTLAGTVTWTLETLLSSSVKQDGGDSSCAADCDGETFIHQVNDQYSVYDATWVMGNSASNNPGNVQTDMANGQMVVGHSLSMEFWHAQTNHIPYDRTVISVPSVGEEVTGSFGSHDGDHNPLNN